jgi:hypothetical protein
MDILFLDDSVQSGCRGGMGRLLSIGGIIVPETSLQALTQVVDEIAKQAGIPDDCELKWSPPADNWIHDNLKGQAREDCYRAVLEAVSGLGVRAVVVAWDEARTKLRGNKATAEIFKYAFERFLIFLQHPARLGLMIADRPGGGRQQETELLASFLTNVESGTEYILSNRHVPINILTTPSHLVRHLQVADLVVGVTTAMVAGLTNFASPLFPVVHNMLLTNGEGLSGGTGLKLFPEELTNLYYWVLNEKEYGRVGQTPLPLPAPEWPYYIDESDPATGFPEDE